MGACLTPFIANRGQPNEGPVPCGKCMNCLKRKISEWSFRLMQEDKVSSSAYFITLTYDTDKVPITKNGFMDLSERDLCLFWKRLRKAHERLQPTPTLKYFGVGEYGGRTKRPHYHAILFNAQLDLIQPAWGLGHVHYGQVSEASVGYTLKYMMKPKWKPMHRNDDRTPQFRKMSKGLGANYLTPRMIQWHKEDLTERMYCNIQDGKKIAMPRYYKLKMYTVEEMEQISNKAQKKARHELEKAIEKAGGPEMYHHNKTEEAKASWRKLSAEERKRSAI